MPVVATEEYGEAGLALTVCDGVPDSLVANGELSLEYASASVVDSVECDE